MKRPSPRPAPRAPPWIIRDHPIKLLRSGTDLFPRALKAEFLDGRTQPVNRRAVVDLLTRLYQERGRLRSRRQLIGFAQRGQFRVMLERPVHIDAARFAILDIIFVFSSTLRTDGHNYFPLICSPPCRCYSLYYL